MRVAQEHRVLLLTEQSRQLDTLGAAVFQSGLALLAGGSAIALTADGADATVRAVLGGFSVIAGMAGLQAAVALIEVPGASLEDSVAAKSKDVLIALALLVGSVIGAVSLGCLFAGLAGDL